MDLADQFRLIVAEFMVFRDIVRYIMFRFPEMLI